MVTFCEWVVSAWRLEGAGPIPELSSASGNRVHVVHARLSSRACFPSSFFCLSAFKLDEEPDNAVTSFFRKGFKNKTWWEEAGEEETSTNWRT